MIWKYSFSSLSEIDVLFEVRQVRQALPLFKVCGCNVQNVIWYCLAEITRDVPESYCTSTYSHLVHN